MDYPFENLTPEKFQLFCQALLVKEHSGLQCFPVAQPDGGRDATQHYFRSSREKDFMMFQVKFVRNPHSIDVREWLEKIIKQEAPKVKQQLANGAKRFVLMTNVSGTAHPDVGSIDKINDLLEKELGIPSMCLWRNDLSRRLDNEWSLKWTYPELMTGPDFIRLVLEKNLSEDGAGRTTTIKAFITNQFESDKYVKFKQVDLENRLLDLFIDVPIEFGPNRIWRRAELDDELHYVESFEGLGRQYLEYFTQNGQETMGAATYLLGAKPLGACGFFVVEGAPGQGKSTIAQYLCQVHRMRILTRTSDLKQIPDEHKSGALRLPIKVDLRDFATWLSKRNPFSAEGEEIADGYWAKSLEAFLSALIRHHSGGCEFNVSDLHAIGRLSSVLLVLDGLDEVADIKRREDVVTEIVKGAERLRSSVASIQVIVTSRPAAFENSPGLPNDKFHYLSLGSVTKDLIDEYAEKWLKARKFKDKESAEVRKILKQKLDQPHLRDLARNPMQLAILLSLIHTRGVSLPDKRTAVYDNYVELFFNRESEKSTVVRENRDLLIDIHRYLAWLLHAESEQATAKITGQSAGAIDVDRLKRILHEYLISEGQRPEIADELFTGMVERVVALVSRVQGTYEFEVQPLREYFAARFLYETAPYSPTGNERKGTKPDRFDAISRNFYWLNVTRFYAGCYSKGELPSLIDRLGELIQDDDFRHLSHPRILGATLLGDWVFTQHPKSVSEVIQKILDGLGLRFLLSSASRRDSASNPLVLPSSCGKDELIQRCLLLLRSMPSKDLSFDLIDLLKSNITREEILPIWKEEIDKTSGNKKTIWLEYGLRLGCIASLKLSEIDQLISDEPLSIERMTILVKSNRFDFFSPGSEYCQKLVQAFLNRQLIVNRGSKNSFVLEAFSRAIDVRRYAFCFQQNGMLSHHDYFLHHGEMSLQMEGDLTADAEDDEMMKSCLAVIKAAENSSAIDDRRWENDLKPWEEVATALVLHFGEQWAVFQLANIAAGIKDASETCTDFSDLFDSDKSLCRRARYARLRAGTPAWWIRQLKAAAGNEHRMFCCLLYFTWASSSTITQTLDDFAPIIESFTGNQWNLLFELVEEAVALTRQQVRVKHDAAIGVELSHYSVRILAILRISDRSGNTDDIYNAWLQKVDDWDEKGLQAFRQNAISKVVKNQAPIDDHLNVLSRGYQFGLLSEPYESYRFSQRNLLGKASYKTACEIVEKAELFPSFLVTAAERRCRAETASKVRPVGGIAEQEGWFI